VGIDTTGAAGPAAYTSRPSTMTACGCPTSRCPVALLVAHTRVPTSASYSLGPGVPPGPWTSPAGEIGPMVDVEAVFVKLHVGTSQASLPLPFPGVRSRPDAFPATPLTPYRASSTLRFYGGFLPRQPAHQPAKAKGSTSPAEVRHASPLRA